MTDDERAIRGVVETWMAATRAGDYKKVLSLVAEDMIFMVAGQPPFGKAEFAAGGGTPSNMHIDGHADVLEVQVAGPWAYIRNFIEVTITVDDAPPVRRSGHTLSILRKEPDGRWLLTRDANLVS